MESKGSKEKMRTRTRGIQRIMSAAVASLACIAMLTGCSNSTTSSESAEDTAASALEVAQKAIDGKVLSTGANGEKAASADVADLTDEEVQKIKDAHLRLRLYSTTRATTGTTLRSPV